MRITLSRDEMVLLDSLAFKEIGELENDYPRLISSSNSDVAFIGLDMKKRAGRLTKIMGKFKL